MDGAIAGVFKMAAGRNDKATSDTELLKEIETVKQSIETVSSRFEFQSDPDLVEACIYEMQALAAKYRYLTREARRLGLTKSSLHTLKRVE